jgi:hypothetical protein
MNDIYPMFSDDDLLMLIQVLLPECRDKKKMIRALRQDEDILEGMLADEKIFNHLMAVPESFIKISPHLFFAVLIHRVKNDLMRQSYTIERESRLKMIIFDSSDVVKLLKEKSMVLYLIDMLVSFIRINSYSTLTKVKKGVWRKFKFSDFDIDSLIRYSQIIDEDQRFPSYKRIADICLFVTGIFPDYIDAQERYSSSGHRRLRTFKQWNRDGIEQYGTYFYRAAAQHSVARLKNLHSVLMNLSENFVLAAKPLTLMTGRYLGYHKDKFFLQ